MGACVGGFLCDRRSPLLLVAGAAADGGAVGDGGACGAGGAGGGGAFIATHMHREGFSARPSRSRGRLQFACSDVVFLVHLSFGTTARYT